MMRCVSRTWGSYESVQEFAARINKLGTQIFQSGNSAQSTAVRNANDQLLQSRFISGLRNDIRRFVLARDPLNLDESISAALIEEQNMKLNQIANDERSGLSPSQTENSVVSALTNKLEEINLRVGRLQEASSVTARKAGGEFFNRRETVFKCFYCGIQGHRQAECRKKKRDDRSANYVEKLLPSLEQTFNKALNNLKDQEASHVDLSTRATKQHHYDYKIGSLCFIKTPNIKSNLSPKLRPKFEGPYRVIERFSNVNYRVQHVEQLRKRFNTHVNRMIPFKRFSYLHLNNLDDLQPDETDVKSIVPSPRLADSWEMWNRRSNQQSGHCRCIKEAGLYRDHGRAADFFGGVTT
ncbi:integrase catalytic domain-containing protein [Trichonephila clavipes]|nr:integrase catalytic domain-containing protein [Trichonephila clavipes]